MPPFFDLFLAFHIICIEPFSSLVSPSANHRRCTANHRLSMDPFFPAEPGRAWLGCIFNLAHCASSSIPFPFLPPSLPSPFPTNPTQTINLANHQSPPSLSRLSPSHPSWVIILSPSLTTTLSPGSERRKGGIETHKRLFCPSYYFHTHTTPPPPIPTPPTYHSTPTSSFYSPSFCLPKLPNRSPDLFLPSPPLRSIYILSLPPTTYLPSYLTTYPRQLSSLHIRHTSLSHHPPSHDHSHPTDNLLQYYHHPTNKTYLQTNQHSFLSSLFSSRPSFCCLKRIPVSSLYQRATLPDFHTPRKKQPS